LAARIGAKARARKRGPKKFVSMFARMSASVTSSRLALGGFAPALLMSTVTSGAAASVADEVRSDAAVYSGDEDDRSVDRGRWCSFLPG
jgi:hypothetical protein